jgi:plastocyanin
MRTTFLIAAAAAVLVACSPQADEPASDPIAISVADFMIDPDDLTATGPMITFEVTNDGPTPHNFTVRNEAGEVVAATSDLSSGESETLDAKLEPGTYTIFCSLAGHESLGMSGTLTVTGP